MYRFVFQEDEFSVGKDICQLTAKFAAALVLAVVLASLYETPLVNRKFLLHTRHRGEEQRLSDAGGTGSDLMVGVTAELEVLENSVRRLQNTGITRPVILLGQVRTQEKIEGRVQEIGEIECGKLKPSRKDKNREDPKYRLNTQQETFSSRECLLASSRCKREERAKTIATGKQISKASQNRARRWH